MSESIRKVLFLRAPDADEVFASAVMANLPKGVVEYEVLNLMEGQYDAILDRLEPGILPVVLKAPRSHGT